MHRNDPGNVVVGGRYEHYSGKQYVVIGIAHHTETLEKVVVYQALQDDVDFGPAPVWVRPYGMFVEVIEVQGRPRPRFALLSSRE